MNHSTGADVAPHGVLDMLIACAKPVPRMAELVGLPDLASALALVGSAKGAHDLSEHDAASAMVGALLGTEQWADRAPAALAVWRLYASGPELLGDTPVWLDGTRYPSARERALRYVGEAVNLHRATLATAAADASSDAPAPRFLAVVLADALRAFDFPDLGGGMQSGSAAPIALPAPSHQPGAMRPFKLAQLPVEAAPEASAMDVSALRQRIADHKPVKKLKRNWPDPALMLAELLRQYRERMELPDACAATCEEKIAGLWRIKQNTVHAYLTNARKLEKAAAAPAGEPLAA
jgi:hypothetical protein